jgi:DNA polymerase I-like protein with 3'-5' exonuclease and polymerase domains
VGERPPTQFAETPRQARRFMDELYQEAYLQGKVTAVDTEFVPVTHEPVLMSYSWGRGIRRVVRAELIKEHFGDWLVDRQTKLAYQNYKEDVETMGKLGLPEAELAHSFYIDVMVAGVLRDETLVKHSLKAQALHFLKWFRREYGQLFCYVPPGKKKAITMDPRQVMDGLPPEALTDAVLKWGTAKGGHKVGPRTADAWRQLMEDYAGDDAESTQILAVDHRRYLKKTDYWDKYVSVDREFTLTLMQCEDAGALLDQPVLRKILRKQQIRIMRAERCFRSVAGNPKLNLRSGPQMKKLLFDEWGWPEHPTIETDSGGVSMDKEVLTWWSKEHKLEMADVKLAYNNACTMEGTFLTGLLTGVDEDGRLRSDLNQIGAKTCLPAGELVLTNRGYLPTEDVRVGDLVITHEGRARRVLRTIDNGRKMVYQTRLSNGLQLRTTGNHEFMTNGGWIRADQLKSGIHFVTAHAAAPEEWRIIHEFPAFEVSSWGRVRNRFTGNVLALQSKSSYGHLKVMLVRNGSKVRGPDRKDFAVHCLVLEAFSNEDRKPEVRHWNGIPWDNTVTNLAWATRRENAQDMARHRSGRGPVTYAREIVDTILSTLHVRGGRGRSSSDQALADELGMSRSNVSAIRLGKSRIATLDVPEKRATFYAVPLTSVVKVGVMQTYGLVVDEDHSHVTGGIVTHNSGRISSRKFDRNIEMSRTLKSGVVKTWTKKKKVGANLQNIPARKEKDPDGIRGAFRAPLVGEVTAWGDRATEPHKLIIADYSGFHLMLVIHFVSKLTNESAMLEIMKKYGTPSAVHVYTTIQMFKHAKPHYCDPAACKDKTGQWKKGHGENKSFSLKEFTMDDWKLVKPIFPDQYTYSKNTNFALIFLGSPWTLAYNTGRDANDPEQLEECKRHFDDWYELYPEIPIYQNHMIDHGYEHGWVPTIGGRRGHVRMMLEGCDKNGKYIQDDDKRKKMIKHGERVCTNTPAQGSEADIVKMALNLIRKSEMLRALRVAPLFPVHDEIVSEGPGSTSEKGLAEKIRLMKQPYRELMDFELAVEGGIGDNWLSGKP